MNIIRIIFHRIFNSITITILLLLCDISTEQTSFYCIRSKHRIPSISSILWSKLKSKRFVFKKKKLWFKLVSCDYTVYHFYDNE